MSDPNGVRPRQSRHTVIDYRIKLELSVQISGDELGLRVKLRYQHKQECMPVGCVPSASMAIPWWGVGGNRDTCENITLPQTSFAGGKKTTHTAH